MPIEEVSETYFVCTKCKGLVEPRPFVIEEGKITEIQFLCTRCDSIVGYFRKVDITMTSDIDKEIQSFLVSSSDEGEGTIVKMINKMGKEFVSLYRLGDRCWGVEYRTYPKDNDIVYTSFIVRSETAGQAVCKAYMDWTAKKKLSEKEEEGKE